MRSNLPAILFVAVLAAVLGGDAVQSRAQGFGLFANAYLDSTRAPRTRITVEVPFRSLVFFKKEGYYDTRYQVYVAIREDRDDAPHPRTYVMHGFATVQSYEETRRRDQKSRTFREFDLPPGDYVIDGTLTVKDTQIAMQRSITLRVPDFLSSGIGFGTPVVLSVPIDQQAGFSEWSRVKDKLQDVVAPQSAEIAGLERQPAVRFALFVDGDLPQPEPCDIYYEVKDAGDHQRVYGKRRVTLTGKNDEFVVVINVDDFSPGVYHVNLRARTVDTPRDATAGAAIRIDVTRAMLGVNFDDTIEILGLIASNEELKPLRAASEAERAAAWQAFWKARDPDPSSDANEALTQFIARLEYVTREFSQFSPGWRTDRGRVFIRYGPPEQVDTAMDQRSSGEYEIWRYYSIGRSFVFYDMFGVGDYKLVEGEL
jgi:GWxTD domain-containing protein